MTLSLRRWMIAAIALAFSHCAQAQDAPTRADWVEIQRVIAAQRDALISGDGDRAYALAAPSIRGHFGDVATFMRMVRESYRPLLDARYVEFLEGAVIGGDVVQPLRLVMRDGTVLVAIYGAQRQAGGEWRITACVIAPSTVRSA